ncbi:tetraacyldisaccharide 4'-kinase [Trichloromonas acetexigens]|uniref:Multifunctional fusion protein n=1 Tax=Trichloromonas acetexigens TaxID=38815 RepID=A0A550JHR4_9BACT|nr:tetraacyldisaccharide 4'-kinase [Desulfuromonas acetexigens]TRO82748.1 tetraacyldisaccharide 4'-kinase [Desulfuromonas acetexigens]
MPSLFQWYRPVWTEGPRTQAQHLLYRVLSPFSELYGRVGQVRVALYQRGLLRSHNFPVPVISIGNLAVGGTGKTPTVDWVARYCQGRGRRVAVVSRGYGGRGASDVAVVSDGRQLRLSPEVAGDEPVLLARRNPQLIVVAAPRRAQGVWTAILELGADLIILDDGFQHLAVRRDLDIVLLDAKRPLGNGRVLPAGLLREFPEALARGDLFILTRADEETVPPDLPGPVLTSRHRLADRVTALDGKSLSFDSLQGKRLVAFAGIADPEAFFSDLRGKGLTVSETLAFPDHVTYNRAELASINAAGGDLLLTTEKDAVKLRAADFTVPCCQVPLELTFDRPELLTAHLDRLTAKERTMPIKQELLDILACPQCKGPVRLRDDQQALVCNACRLAYPIRDDIPVMLIDEATKIGEE